MAAQRVGGRRLQTGSGSTTFVATARVENANAAATLSAAVATVDTSAEALSNVFASAGVPVTVASGATTQTVVTEEFVVSTGSSAAGVIVGVILGLLIVGGGAFFYMKKMRSKSVEVIPA